MQNEHSLSSSLEKICKHALQHSSSMMYAMFYQQKQEGPKEELAQLHSPPFKGEDLPAVPEQGEQSCWALYTWPSSFLKAPLCLSIPLSPCSHTPLATGIRYMQIHAREIQELQHQLRNLESMCSERNKQVFCESLPPFRTENDPVLAPSLLLLRKDGIFSVKRQ